jgi:hypothetical protein
MIDFESEQEGSVRHRRSNLPCPPCPLSLYPQIRAGTLEEDFRPSKRCLKWFSQGGLGINELLLDLWQLVLGGFWNQIFRNQAYDDPRTPSFWSLSVVKKRSKIASKQNPQSHKLNYLPVSFAPMLIPFSYFLTPLMNKNRSRWSFPGNFRLVNLIFN